VFDVFLYGMISPSTVHVLRSDFAYPKANTYGEIASTLTSIGGEAANSAIVLSKLGLRTKLDGNWIHPRSADHVLGLLGGFGIDISRLSVNAAGGTIELVIADKETRTVFGNYAAFHAGPPQWNEPQAVDIEDAAVVCLDPYFRDQSRLAAELCVRYEKPYVTLDSRYDDFVAQNAACVVISHELRDQAYPGADHREIFDQYRQHCRGLVVFTFGGDELWYGRIGVERRVHKPFAIDPLDTCGAGDSFRGAIAYAILKAWNDEQTLEFASGVAACVCMTTPHTLNAPGLEQILEFIRSQRAQ
jgi:sugar/nucleoside kinase (ribokinase family)